MDTPNGTIEKRTPAHGAWWSLFRLRCPRCHEGRLFRGLFQMNDPCPVCGLVFEREPGYFYGAMYVSYPIAIVILLTFYLIAQELLPDWSPQMVSLLVLVPYIPLMPLVFRYARAIWIYFDRWCTPGEVSSHAGWLQWRQKEQKHGGG